jgi:hypothetical protein
VRVGLSPGKKTGKNTSMSDTHLKETLQQLHEELQRADKLDDADQALLSTALEDIQRKLTENAAQEPDLSDRLEAAALRFQLENPELSGMVQKLVTVLRRAGI